VPDDRDETRAPPECDAADAFSYYRASRRSESGPPNGSIASECGTLTASVLTILQAALTI